jgi:hypothetical protein
MIYVYDVLVNLSEELFDFYDWNENDDFVHVRRVPTFKVSNEVYFDVAVKKVRLDEEVLASIKDKTQVFSSRNIEVLPYSAVFTNGENAIMVEFNSKGYTSRKSKFLVNEEIEILDIAKSMKVSSIHYNVINNRVKMNGMLRSEKVIIDRIVNELSFLKDNDEKISYLYYEWFERQDGVNKYDSLVKDLKSGFTNKHLEFMELLELLQK